MVKHVIRVGEVIEIGSVKIRLDHKSGQCVSLVIDAPSDVKINIPSKNGEQSGNKRKNTLSLS